jgi:hypothetical protein
MKQMNNRALAVLPALLASIVLSACSGATPVVKTITAAEDGAPVYSIVYDNGNVRETDPFTPEDASFYQAETGDFSARIVHGKIVNTLMRTDLTDENGTTLPADTAMSALMQAAADTIDHDIAQFTIIKAQDDYFTLVKLNVNWSDPATLYRYNADSGTLTVLHQWDGVDLLGIASVR